MFHTTPWMMPLLVDLSDWRTKLAEIAEKLYNDTTLLDAVFVADFPGQPSHTLELWN
jgi:vitamin K-dependent gamma-carboxylase